MSQYSCKWHAHSCNMLPLMENLKTVGNFVDVTIVSEGRNLRAHRLVLSANSPFFHQTFLTNPCAHPVIVLQDIKYSTIKLIIDFMYRGEIDIPQNEMDMLLKAAKTLQIKGLMDISEERQMSQAMECNSQENSTNKSFSMPLKSPPKKKQNTQSGDFQVQSDDETSKQTKCAVSEECNISSGKTCEAIEKAFQSAFTDSTELSSAEPAIENANIEIQRHVIHPEMSTQNNCVKKKKAEITSERQVKRTSRVWNYFTHIDNSFALCKMCKKNISRKSSITNLKKHIKNKHVSVYHESFSTLKKYENAGEHEPMITEKDQFEQCEDQGYQEIECAIEIGPTSVVMPSNANHKDMLIFTEGLDKNQSGPIIHKL